MLFSPRGRRRRRYRWTLLLAILVAGSIIFIILAAISDQNPRQPGPAPLAAVVTDQGQESRPPLVLTYFYYWYDATTGAHLEPEFLANNPPADPAPSWRSVAWFRKELSDMTYAGIDVVLPVYWGTTEEWSTAGLTNLAQAWQELKDQGQDPPKIGLFLDTPILKDRDLTTPEGKGYFYESIREFFDRIPEDQWALIDGRPIIWLFTSTFPDAFNQATFDFVYERFEREFRVRPYIVRELSWDYAVLGHRGGDLIRDGSQPIATEARYVWGAAQNGFSDLGTVATVGPGYDESHISDRGGVVRPRDDGRWYSENFTEAIASGKRMLAIETWNELHEASGISETQEFGRTYLDLTRRLTTAFREAHRE